MGNLEGDPGRSIPGAENQEPSPEAETDQDFWDYKKFQLDETTIKEIEADHEAYQAIMSQREVLEEPTGPAINAAYKKISDKRSGDVLDLQEEIGVYVGFDRIYVGRQHDDKNPEEKAAIIKNGLDKKREIFQELIDQVGEITRERQKDNPDFDYWNEVYRLKETSMEAARKIDSSMEKFYPIDRRSPPRIGTNDFIQRVREELLSQELPTDHPFQTILGTEVDDYDRTGEEDVLRILNDAKVEIDDIKTVKDGNERRRAVFLKLKGAIEHAKEMPAVVRARFLQIAATYVFEGGYKLTPYAMEGNWADLDIEKFLKTLEDRVGKNPPAEQRLVASGDPDIRRLGLEGAAREHDRAAAEKKYKK
jgi:hypothetical protein